MTKRTIKRMVLMLVIVILGLGAVAFKKYSDIQQMIAEFQEPAPPTSITAAKVSESTWTPRATAVGNFNAVQGSQLAAEVGGIVSEIHFANGDTVSQGQRLVTLDTDSDRAELERLAAAEELAKLELNRYRRLHDEGNVSDSELQRRESEAAQATAAAEAQRARIRQKTIRAPFDGISGIRRVNLGQYVNPGTPVVAVQALDPIYINFNLPERRLADVEVGQELNVQVDTWPGQDFTGTISAIQPSVEQSTRTFEIQAELENPEQRLRPGMFGRVQLDTGAARTVKVVPQTAIQFNPYGNSVFLIQEDDEGELSVMQRFVTTGERRGDMIAITDGLELGDRVASSGLLKLRNNTRVSINDDESVQPSTDENPQPPNS